jgi:hypothetical protein
MANAGMAGVSDIVAIDFNPAGLASQHRISFSVASSSAYHRYSLFRQNVGNWAFDEGWNESRFSFDHAGAGVRLGERLSFGVGYFRKIDPFTDNDRRAITGSSLFHQTTSGGIEALIIGSSIKLSEHFMTGASLHFNSGTITSQIRGDDHGRETHKWAVLQNDIDGVNGQFGVIFKMQKFSAGITVSTASGLNAEANTQISENRDYESLFPAYDRTTWKLPLIVGVGFAYTGYKNWLFAFDFETQRFEESNLQLNLYEFGGQPNWKCINIFRAGVEVYPFKSASVPLRLGYSYTPQLYASNNSVGVQNTVLEYDETKQNVKHLFAAGTTLSHANFSFHLGFEYAILQWHRDWQTSMVILDDYTEKKYNIFGVLEYHLD